MKTIIANINDAGQRIDKFVSKVASAPMSLIYRAIRKRRIKVNHKKCDISYMLSIGDVVELYINDEFFDDKNIKDLQIVPNINVAYEDQNILVVNKSSGVIVQKDNINDLTGHVRSYLSTKQEYNPKQEHSFAPSSCHRIDKNTSGLVMFAKNAQTLRILNSKLRSHEIRKFYICILKGIPAQKYGSIEGYLWKDKIKNKTIVCSGERSGAVRAITKYKILNFSNNSSLAHVELVTGRSHQIRAHFSSIGHPILGDYKYGGGTKNSNIKFQCLCAYRINFDFNTDAGILSYLSQKNIECAPLFNL